MAVGFGVANTRAALNDALVFEKLDERRYRLTLERGGAQGSFKCGFPTPAS